jgi:hypothetical protein
MHSKMLRFSAGILSLAVAMSAAPKTAHAKLDGSCPDPMIYATDPWDTSIQGWCTFEAEYFTCDNCDYSCPWGEDDGNWCPT